MALKPEDHRGQTISVEPNRSGFRWVLLSKSGEAMERSAYTYATKVGAQLAGEARLAKVGR